MKRHQQLQPLSRQHHNGLLAVLLLHKGINKADNTNVMAAFILDFWQYDLKAHFESEETILIPALKETAFDETLTRRLLNEHFALRSYINSLETGYANKETISDFADLLEEHIRFEERTYFPEAEMVLSEEALITIGDQLHEDDEPNCMNYPIKFWK